MVMCDVVPVHVENILLERPRQYDRKMMHNEYKNRYSFIKDGKSITLASLTPAQAYKDQINLKSEEQERLREKRSEIYLSKEENKREKSEASNCEKKRVEHKRVKKESPMRGEKSWK